MARGQSNRYTRSGSARSGSSGGSASGRGGSGSSSGGDRRSGGSSSGSGSGDRSDLIEGRHAVEEALACGVPLKSAMVAESSGGTDQALERLAARLAEEGVAVERVPRSRLDALSSHGAHQGVVVRVAPYSYASLGDVIANAGSGSALVVILDHVTDQGNLGAIARSAEVVGAAGLVVPKARAAAVGVGAYKTSAGAVLHLPIAQVSNLARAIDELKDAGFWVCAASEHAEQDVWHAPLEGRLVLVMGSEGEGVSRLVAEKCDFSCRLPQRGQIESLNVAQATTVLCYEWLRRETMGEGTDA